MADANPRADAKLVTGLLARSRKGDQAAYDELTRLPPEVTNFPTRLAHAGNLVLHAERTILTGFFGDQLLVVEGTAARLGELRRDLAGADPSPLERLLIERIAMCWLTLYAAETLLAQNKDKLSRQWCDHYERRIDRSHARYLSALHALASVRRLHLPTIQVNVAERQVNVANSPTVGPAVDGEP